MNYYKKAHYISFCPGEVLGHPNPVSFMQRVKKYVAAKPDMLEFSIPFSDPIADGPVIQAAHEKALKAGLTPRKALRLVSRIRKLTDVPIFLIVYSNLIIKYGIAKFYHDMRKAGASSILIPDVPLEEINPFLHASQKNHIHQILLVSENTTRERLQKISKIGSGFVYVVSALGVTGTRKKLNSNIYALLKKLKKILKLPLMVGFGISKPEHILNLQKAKPDAVVVCSALVKTPMGKLAQLLHLLKKACE